MKTKNITAFVGHSFDENDKSLIRRFLDYFDSIKGIVNEFNWDHAEKAEPKILSKKVREKMEGKNLFIGIFTKRKKEIDDSKLNRRGLFNKKKIITNEEDYYWITSDWIIQESGYALGKGMDQIFLLEDGVNSVGGLQGDIEHINFSREYPEGCFQKLQEMIGALIPKEKIEKGKEISDIPKASEKEKPEIPMKGETEKLKAEWNRKDYDIALVQAIIDKNESKEKEIYEEYLSTLTEENIEEIVDWKVNYLLAKSLFKNIDVSDEIKRLVDENPEHALARWLLGNIYEKFKNYKLASNEYLKSAQYTKDPSIKISRLCQGAISKAKAGEYEEAIEIVGNIFNEKFTKGDSDLFLLLTTLADITLERGELEKYTAFCEGALLIKPEIHNLRFSLAYKYSEMKMNPLALYHYKILTENEPSETNWNNIGVAYSRLEMNAKAISAYNKSEELNGTLAMSNLAHKLISAGFLDEAQGICDKAVKIKNYDKRVGSAILKIGDVRNEENEKENKVLENINDRRKFSIEFAMAFRPNEKVELPSKWKSSLCDLDIKIQDGRFLAKGEYQSQEEDDSALFRALIMKTQSSSEPTHLKRIVTYEGIIKGRAIEYNLSISQRPGEGPAEKEIIHKNGLMAILKDKTEILVLEKDKDNKEELYSLKPIGNK